MAGRNTSLADRIKQSQEVRGVDKLLVSEEDIIDQENPKSSNEPEIEPKSEIISESNPKYESEINPETKPESISNPNHNPINSTTNNPKSNPKYEKVKYTDSRTQRAFYYETKLIKIFDKHYPASKFNKSEIMNDLLRKFLEENKLI